MAPTLSKEQRRARLDMLFRQRAALDGEIVLHLGEVERGEEYRDEGATSTEAWTVERFGIAVSTARALTRVGQKASDLPHLVGALSQGAVSFDKVRAVADVATAESDQELCGQAKEHSVRELADIARSAGARARSASRSPSEHDRRFLRFNDQCRTVTAQLPAESYAETRACLQSWANAVAADEETPLDQRLCDGFMGMVRFSTTGSSGPTTKGNPNLVVVHVPLATLVDVAGQGSELAGELERDGLIDTDTVRRIACDATVAVAVDDDVGHTMYEGRARRFPTDAQRREVMRRDRQCRFPGCTNVTFADVHHIVAWKPGGRTDLENLALMCRFHHGVVHRNGWTMTGNANEELTLLGPSGRVMVSRPSPLWTRVTARC
ncbi:MAG TPA: DUF222 domain-containing protein [Acidimicrobiales bacterium]|jgi:hypothetical protein|nr:DUF222 domain-containing protein [Acidimicrobiales bacterium]